MTKEELAGRIEHSLLRPDATEADVVRLCAEAAEHQFYGVCVNPWWVPEASAALEKTNCRIAAVVGFPFGATFSVVKAKETEYVLDHGATEVDVVMNVGALRSGQDGEVEHDIAMVVKAADGSPVKVILECCYLTETEIKLAAKIAMDAGAAFVKTSTGFAPRGATVEDIRLLKRTVGERVGIKAAGGIADLATAMCMLRAGADRLGSSSSVKIMREAASPEGAAFLRGETLARHS